MGQVQMKTIFKTSLPDSGQGVFIKQFVYMSKIDLIKKYKSYYTAKPKPELVTIEAAQFLSITGKGDPSEKDFTAKIQALYSVAYAIKFQLKALGKDFAVSKLEGLWWFDEKKYSSFSIDEAPTGIPRTEWEFRLLIRLPDFVARQDVPVGIKTAAAKKRLPFAHDIELFEMNEGKSVQMLHVGPFDTEPETLRIMRDFITTNQLHKNGHHHEIYLSDFRKVSNEKMKTILREPVR